MNFGSELFFFILFFFEKKSFSNKTQIEANYKKFSSIYQKNDLESRISIRKSMWSAVEGSCSTFWVSAKLVFAFCAERLGALVCDVPRDRSTTSDTRPAARSEIDFRRGSSHDRIPPINDFYCKLWLDSL